MAGSHTAVHSIATRNALHFRSIISFCLFLWGLNKIYLSVIRSTKGREKKEEQRRQQHAQQSKNPKFILIKSPALQVTWLQIYFERPYEFWAVTKQTQPCRKTIQLALNSFYLPSFPN
jgi:hypothetical protein